MHIFSKIGLLFGLAAVPTSAIRILLSNDDGWASANLREMYKMLQKSGHDVFMVAPINDQSGTGGSVGFSRASTLARPGEFNIVDKGSPSFGRDSTDSKSLYYDGTPAATLLFALDYAIPTQKPWGDNVMPELFISGPNEGSNVGGFMFLQSGTIGAASAAIARGIPSIAFSAADSAHRVYTQVTNDDDVAVINARVATMFVDQISKVMQGESGEVSRTFPAGYGVSVNLPVHGVKCNNPAFLHSRLTGGLPGIKAVYDAGSSTFFPQEDSSLGSILNTCINGDCSLPGEADVVKTCGASVVSFTIDYDAPNCRSPTLIREFLANTLKPLNEQVRMAGTPIKLD